MRKVYSRIVKNIPDPPDEPATLWDQLTDYIGILIIGGALFASGYAVRKITFTCPQKEPMQFRILGPGDSIKVDSIHVWPEKPVIDYNINRV